MTVLPERRYSDEVKLNPYDRNAIQAFVDVLAPRRERRWQFWRRSETERYKIEFALVTLMLRARG